MRIIECDRCHKRFNKDAKKTGYVNLDQRDIKTGELEGNREFDDWDVCDDCMQKIREFVRMVPPVRQEPDRPGSNVPKQHNPRSLPCRPHDICGTGADDERRDHKHPRSRK